jgi:hypothetical protein
LGNVVVGPIPTHVGTPVQVESRAIPLMGLHRSRSKVRRPHEGSSAKNHHAAADAGREDNHAPGMHASGIAKASTAYQRSDNPSVQFASTRRK